MKYDIICQIVKEQGSKIFSVTFLKKDGTLRTMLVQDAVTKFLCKGDAASEAARKAVLSRKLNNPNLLNVYDIQKQAIRSINMDTVIQISGKGQILYTDPSVLQEHERAVWAYGAGPNTLEGCR